MSIVYLYEFCILIIYIDVIAHYFQESFCRYFGEGGLCVCLLYIDKLSANKMDVFLSFFQSEYLFIYFSCFIALTRISINSMMLNESSEKAQ